MASKEFHRLGYKFGYRNQANKSAMVRRLAGMLLANEMGGSTILMALGALEELQRILRPSSRFRSGAPQECLRPFGARLPRDAERHPVLATRRTLIGS